MKSAMTVMMCFMVTACATKRPPPEFALDELIEAMPAVQVSDVMPMHIVEVPKPIPFPNQLKPLPELSAPTPAVPPKDSVKDANTAARIEPTPSGFINAIQTWPYTPGALYQVYTVPGKVTDIALEPGEALIDISAPDPVRWIIGDTRSGEGAAERQHVIVKPVRADLQTNLAIFTNRRAYHLELKSTPETWMAAVSWHYPADTLVALKAESRTREQAQPVAVGLALENLRFRYDISGDDASWKPVRAFDDGQKVYIQFPAGIGQGEMPPLFVVGEKGDAQLVNYRVRSPYYIVDRLFSAAELRLGGKEAQVVRIERTDLKLAKGRR